MHPALAEQDHRLWPIPRGRLFRAEVHHVPWPLQPASAEIVENGLGTPHGIDLPGQPPLLHFAHRIDVVVWSPARVDDSQPIV